MRDSEFLPHGLERQTLALHPSSSRVVLRDFTPANEPRDHNPTDINRANHIVDRVLLLDAGAASEQLAGVLEGFDGRHRNLPARLEARAAALDGLVDDHGACTLDQRRLVGAYFLLEYAFEAAALFNPSIVADPDQSRAPTGGLRFILSLRAVGEGHVSSLTFRSGTLDVDGVVAIDPVAGFAALPSSTSRGCGSNSDCVAIEFNGQESISERVIFPVTEAQANGIEDARFVVFRDEVSATYYATYTAYSGVAIRSELLETKDFISFKMTPLRGSAATGKGMALFPRLIGGRYAMIGRQDNENLYLIYSSDLHVWDGGVAILKPTFPWEFVQIGNCGSPIELEQGWLLLTHGVGPMRQYAIGAVLLDRDDPSKVIGRSSEPILGPGRAEWPGYVPNVVYTCGSLRHGNRIIIPFAIADTFCTFATVSIADMLAAIDI